MAINKWVNQPVKIGTLIFNISNRTISSNQVANTLVLMAASKAHVTLAVAANGGGSLPAHLKWGRKGMANPEVIGAAPSAVAIKTSAAIMAIPAMADRICKAVKLDTQAPTTHGVLTKVAVLGTRAHNQVGEEQAVFLVNLQAVKASSSIHRPMDRGRLDLDKQALGNKALDSINLETKATDNSMVSTQAIPRGTVASPGMIRVVGTEEKMTSSILTTTNGDPNS